MAQKTDGSKARGGKWDYRYRDLFLQISYTCRYYDIDPGDDVGVRVARLYPAGSCPMNAQ